MAYGSTPNLSGVRVLVVEDDDDTRYLLTEVLKLTGASVTAAGSTGEALAALALEVPDVLISDIGLPDEDGYGLIRRVRVGERGGPRVPAIALTAFARDDDGQRAVEAGFDMHVAKPIDEPALFRSIAALAGRTAAVVP